MTSLLAMMCLGVSSCDDGFIFESEGDCSPKVKFIFKKHRQALHSAPGREADAFYSVVGSVHLFVTDKNTGEIVFEKFENTENLQSESSLGIGDGQEKCFLPLDLAPGSYHIVAWCGLDETDQNNAFSLADASRSNGYSHCSVKRSPQTGHPVNLEKYDALYHGRLENVDITIDSEGAQIFPIELTKNTNDIAVWVQHATQKFGEGDYEVVYTDANGSMHFHDNSLLDEDKRLEYHPHSSSVLTASTEYNGSTMETGALVAHLSTSRLLASHKDDARLEVRSKEGDVVFSIPFIKYLLNMQMLSSDDQYYLDCEDTYNCSFYLSGENGAWLPSTIIINNWVVVPQQQDNL